MAGTAPAERHRFGPHAQRAGRCVTTAMSLPAMRPTVERSRFIAGVPMKRAAKVVAGRAYSARGAASCSMRPWFSSTTWSAMLIASAWSCVT